MIIAATEELKERNVNYQQLVHITATDIDPTCVHASYVQFTLLHIPAIVIHGDSLSHEELSRWYTLSHTMGGWDRKLKTKAMFKSMMEVISTTQIPQSENNPAQEIDIEKSHIPVASEQDKHFPGTQLTIF